MNFAIPPKTVKRESIFCEFENIWSQLEHLTPSNEELLTACKSKLSDLEHAYSGTSIESKDFSLTREYMIALAGLRKNKDIVICKPDKGSGVVVLDKKDYDRQNDNTKFCTLGQIPQYDRTSTIERNLQSLLLRLKKSNQITGSKRPRMYGLPKIHKEGAPLRPILSMIKSAQHSLAKELSLLLSPVLDKFSSRVIKDSFSFVNELRALNVNTNNLIICSFDVVSLFTNIPLDETIKICADTLYHTDINLPLYFGRCVVTIYSNNSHKQVELELLCFRNEVSRILYSFAWSSLVKFIPLFETRK